MTISPKAAKVKPRRNELPKRCQATRPGGSQQCSRWAGHSGNHQHWFVGELVDTWTDKDPLPASPAASGALEAKPGYSELVRRLTALEAKVAELRLENNQP